MIHLDLRDILPRFATCELPTIQRHCTNICKYRSRLAAFYACSAVIPAGIPLSSRIQIHYLYMLFVVRDRRFVSLPSDLVDIFCIIGPDRCGACSAFVCCREIKCINYGANIESGCVRAFEDETIGAPG